MENESKVQSKILEQLEYAFALGAGQSVQRLATTVFGYEDWEAVKKTSSALQSLKKQGKVLYFPSTKVWFLNK